MTTRKSAAPRQTTSGRTLLLNTADGDMRITLPDGARVTFGPSIPYQKKDSYSAGREGYSLRVYADKGTDSLIAVFGGVNSFRDINLPLAKLIIREAGRSVWKSDEEGYKVEAEVKHKQAWIDPLHQLESGD